MPRECSCLTSASASAPTMASAARCVFSRSSAPRTSGASTTRTWLVLSSAAHMSAASAPSSITRIPTGCMERTIGERGRRAYRENFRNCQNLLLRPLFQLVDRLVGAAHRFLADLVEEREVFHRGAARVAANIARETQRLRRERLELRGAALLARCDDLADSDFHGPCRKGSGNVRTARHAPTGTIWPRSP